MAKILIFLVKIYQLCLTPFLGKNCRFFPTCSEYSIEALKTHGALKGTWLTFKRIIKCGPWHHGGYDPVPPKE